MEVVTSFFEGAAASIHLGVAAAATEEKADRGSTPTPTKEVKERARDSSRGRVTSATEVVDSETVMYGKHCLLYTFRQS